MTTDIINPFAVRKPKKDILYFIYHFLSFLVLPVLLPIRLVSLFVGLIGIWLISFPLSWKLEGFHDKDASSELQKPHGKLRQKLIGFFDGVAGRMIMFGIGIVWVKEINKQNKKTDARLIISNHTASADALLMAACGYHSFISKKSVASMPLLGLGTRLMPCVFVDREDPHSREKTKREITRIATEDGYTPLVLFPEGTTTNTTALIKFKLGAFIPGKPVLPCIIRVSTRFVDPSDAARHMTHTMMRCMACLGLVATVEYLPTYLPSHQEQQDPRLYADNVRRMMSEHAGLPMVEYGYREKRVYEGKAPYETACEEWKAVFSAEDLSTTKGPQPKKPSKKKAE
eukprot:gnl/Dysnectes_brevis/2567_a3092_1228.p1 GENE.gnl/Dysnectes_brevis/2567_a3092_1228~~gnl/Dysnectes_brevis/2567_a3092_1228.p1  ORF type:complete len:351 (+),score=129.84 gnl/Dysnectes_brevis/2567_a3092_1228:26-1054(+)